MTNPSDDYIRPVTFKSKNPVNPNPRLWFDPKTGKVNMDPVDLRDLNLRDFTRIHSFFRRVQAAKINGMRIEHERQNQQEG